MKNYSRCKEKLKGGSGRRRTYYCTECGEIIYMETINPLPRIEWVCPDCRKNTKVYTFVNKYSGKELQIRASSEELADIKAWNISPYLNIKIPQPDSIKEVSNEKNRYFGLPTNNRSRTAKRDNPYHHYEKTTD